MKVSELMHNPPAKITDVISRTQQTSHISDRDVELLKLGAAIALVQAAPVEECRDYYIWMDYSKGP